MIAICNRSLGDMQALLHQLLDYSSLLNRHEQVSVQECSLRDLCQDVTATFMPMAQQHEVALDSECSADVPIRSDYRKLKQIAANLVLNAIKYRRPGAAARVEFSCQPINGEYWKMTVADNGIGISEGDLNVIFDEFQRGAASESVHGTGLGLTITKRLTELLGGRIEATSTPGEGSRFEVTLPCATVSRNGTK
jgi:signal transduction histidine kinase